VITTHDRAHLLDNAIRSVLSSPLIPSPTQVIVVDDDSTDATPEVVQSWGVRYLRIAAHSVASSRNAGWTRADTEYIAFLDDDDAWLPCNMEPQLATLESHPEAGFAYGLAQCATEDSFEPLPCTFPRPPLVHGLAPGDLHNGYPQLGVVLFRTVAVSEVGGFDPRISYHDDGDMMVRVASRRPVFGVEFVGMLYRLRAASKERSDYFWSVRSVRRWRPHVDGVDWWDATRFRLSTRGLFFMRFCEDAAACAEAGHRVDAVRSIARATWVSPLHALRHPRLVALPFRTRQPSALKS
jgi:glycosyltransferase involved in cell wall biosynthesis